MTTVNLNIPNEENQMTMTPFKLLRVRVDTDKVDEQ